MKNINKQISKFLKITLVSVLLLAAFATMAFAQGAGTTAYEYTAGDSGYVIAKVSSQTEIPYTLVVKDAMLSITDDVDYSSVLTDGKGAELRMAYNVTFTENSVTKDFDGDFKLALRVPLALAGKELTVVAISDNNVASAITATLADGYYEFTTTAEFSNYGFVELYDLPTPPLDLGWLFILIGVIVALAAIGAIVFFIVKRIKDKKALSEEKDSEEAAFVPEESTEANAQPEEESSVAYETEMAEEAPLAEVEAEKPVEDGEDLTEENTEEPDLTEEQTVEDTLPLENTAEQESSDITPEPVTVNTESIAIRYRSSFTSRLIQAEANIQDYYTKIKNFILSYKGVKAKTSWNFESFNRSRDQLVKINVKGKALLVYLALDPNEFNVTKYHFTDVSNDAKFSQVRLLMKVKSDRGLKYVLELISALMSNLNIEQGELQSVDYHMPYENNETLARRGIVKAILPQGVKLEEHSSIIEVDVGDLLGK